MDFPSARSKAPLRRSGGCRSAAAGVRGLAGQCGPLAHWASVSTTVDPKLESQSSPRWKSRITQQALGGPELLAFSHSQGHQRTRALHDAESALPRQVDIDLHAGCGRRRHAKEPQRCVGTGALSGGCVNVSLNSARLCPAGAAPSRIARLIVCRLIASVEPIAERTLWRTKLPSPQDPAAKASQ